ncbi:hypothetical protein BBP40_001170 [Aspergillus hancockii]|nr:hypothetical protein BBP40_001170 [Aspergillus hancockii]
MGVKQNPIRRAIPMEDLALAVGKVQYAFLTTYIARHGNAQLDSGSSLVYLNGSDGDTLYCCNSVVADNGDTVCSNLPGGDHQRPFTIPSGDIMTGVAGLSGLISSSNSSTPSPSPSPSASNSTETCVRHSSHDTAIGAGIGVPLGVIALGSIAWALFERRRGGRKRAPSSEIAFLDQIHNDNKPCPRRPVGELLASLPESAELGGDVHSR